MGAWRRVFIFDIILFFMWNFRNLKIWQRSRALIPGIYSLTEKFPKSEMYGLTSQMQRAVRSISENITEGSGKRTSKDFIGYLNNAVGSAKEVQDELMSAGDLGYTEDDVVQKYIDELRRIERMIVGYIEYLRGKGVK